MVKKAKKSVAQDSTFWQTRAPLAGGVTKDDLRAIICKHTSEMLDNPDEYGIYPTTRFYNNLIETIVVKLGGGNERIVLG